MGNIPTEAVLTALAARGVATGIDTKIAGHRVRHDRRAAREIRTRAGSSAGLSAICAAELI